MSTDANDDLELENDDILENDEQDDSVIEGEQEVDANSADSDPDSESDHEVKDAQNAKVEERIGELTRKRKEAEKLAETRQEELQKLQQQILNSQEPQVYDLPDPDDVSTAEFQEAIRSRDKAITDRVAWQQQKQNFETQSQQRTNQSQQQQQQEMQTAATAYTSRAKKLGVSQQELSTAGNIISQVGLHNDVAMHILQDESGPAITKFLSTNMADLLEVANSSPIRAALYIEQKIKPKLNSKRIKSNTLPPTNRSKGGTPDRRDKYPLTGSKTKFE